VVHVSLCRVKAFSLFYVCSKQDLAVSAPFYHAPMSSGAVYVYSGKQVSLCEQIYMYTAFLSCLSANLTLLMPVDGERAGVSWCREPQLQPVGNYRQDTEKYIYTVSQKRDLYTFAPNFGRC